jgi:hypothetical protein
VGDGATLYGGTNVSKKHAFLATSFAVAIGVLVTLPVSWDGSVTSAAAPTGGPSVSVVAALASVSTSAHATAVSAADVASGAAADAATPSPTPTPTATQKAAASSTPQSTADASTQDVGQTAQSSANAVQSTKKRSAPGTAASLATTNTKKVVTRDPAPKAPVKTTPSCPANVTGSNPTAPGDVSKGGVQGTTSADITSFALEMNSIRVSHCMKPIPLANFRFSSCLEQRMFWMAEDPSTDPSSAWGHTGVAKRSDGVPIVGCDGDSAGGMNDTGAVDAQSWWTSIDHRDSLYQPAYSGSTSNVCIAFGMAHGGIPNDPAAFTRAAAYWESC